MIDDKLLADYIASHRRTLATQARYYEKARAVVAVVDQATRDTIAELATLDPDHPMYVTPNGPHWHVKRHNEDMDEYATRSMFDALSHAASELGEIVQFEIDCAAAAAAHDDYVTAWTLRKRAELFGNLADNAEAIAKNASGAPWERNPNYKTPYEAMNRERLIVAAKNALTRINNEGPAGFVVYECPVSECAPSDDDK